MLGVLNYLVLLRYYVVDQYVLCVDLFQEISKLFFFLYDLYVVFVFDFVVFDQILPATLCQCLIVFFYEVS